MTTERENRRVLRAQYRELYREISEILFRHDPIGINFGANTDEYEPEVGTILPRLKGALSEDIVLDIVHQEFSKWFDPVIAGPKEKYRGIAQEIWKTWNSQKP